MLPDFIVEATEHLEEMESSLLRLEQDYEDKEVMDEIFRSIHTIKGAAQFVGIERVSELSHKLENLLDLIRRKEITLNTAITDLLIAGKDRLTLLVDELEQTQAEKTEVSDLVEQLRKIVEGDDAAPDEVAVAPTEKDDTGSVQDELSLDDGKEDVGDEEPGLLAEENMSDEYDEELYNIFLQQLKENIPFLYAQTVELSISVDKQDVLYRCSDSIKSLKSSANYMGYEKLTQHYSNWQHAIENAVEQLSSGKMPDLSFMQDYLDEIIRSFPQAMEGYSQDDAGAFGDEEEEHETASIDSALNSIFADDDPAVSSDSPGDIHEPAGTEESAPEEEPAQGIDLDKALDSIFSDEHSDGPEKGEPSDFLSLDDDVAGEEVTSYEPVGTERKAEKKGKQNSITTFFLENELSDDEYDEELISIFLKKLKADIEYIQVQITEYLAGGDKNKILEQCHDAIGRLASSANYMEYVSLTEFCEVWQSTVEDFLAETSAEENSDVAAGMREFIDKIIEVYPQIVDSEMDEAGTASSASDDIQEQNDDTQDVDHVDAESRAVGEKVTQNREDTASTVEDEALFDKLSTALDVSEYASGVSEGAIDSVIEEIMEAPEAGHTEPPETGLETELEDSLKAPEAGEPQTEANLHLLDQVLASSPDDESAMLAQTDSSEMHDKEMRDDEESDDTSADERVDNAAFDAVFEDTAKDVAEDLPQDIAEEKIESTLSGETKPGSAPLETPAQQQVPEEPEAPKEEQERAPAKKTQVRSSIRVDAEKIDYLMNQVGELVVSRAYFAQLVNEMRGLEQQLFESSGISKSQLKPLHEFAFRLSEAGVHLGRVSNELQEGVMKVRMLPIDQLFKRYPRLVRDLIHDTDKDIKLVTKGEETELDKMVIESISDPLIHIIRNSVDHGLENVEERLRVGKPAQGTLVLEAFHESDHIVLEITDDGRGIDTQRIRNKALEKGLIRQDELERMSEQELTRLIMLPGFSTAEKATKTSGRGVGMDVVKKNIEKLNGTVEIASEVGKGTRLRIKIPLTMAIIQALMVRVGREKFTIPLTTVEETLRVFRHEISEIEGVDVIHLRENTMPIFQLAKIYNIDRQGTDDEKMFVVVVSTGTQDLGLVVDELLGQEEVVIKPLADYLRVESGFGGATILGDGGISLILDIPELVKIAKENQILRQGQRTLGFKRKKRSAAETAEQVH
jgi:two-component system chemotaxis sensor kinase CheA